MKGVLTLENIRLTIDGQTVEVAKGTTVLEAAQAAGIYIPTLCYDPDLEPYGGCRLCVVEIENMRGMPTACTTPATEGMVVHTETSAVNDVRRTVVELLISDHPMDCLTCAKNQRCDLQKIAAYLGITERRYSRIDKALQVDTSNPFFKLDRNYCILCGKCVRTCDEVSMVNAIEIVARGYPSHVSPFGDKPITQSNCISCGECLVRCPTGALVPTERHLPEEHEVKSVCPYCGVGCGIVLGTRSGSLVSLRGDRENPVNGGRLCVKGRFGIVDFVNHSSRLRTPLIKKNGEFVESSWEEALDLVASKLAKYRGNQFAAIASAKCPNEDNYVFQKFTRTVMGTNNIDHCARL